MTTNLHGYTIFGAIEEKWKQTGGRDGQLGLPVGNEAPTFDGIGRAQPFAGGTLSWRPETGAHMVYGLIFERWAKLGREQFGYPVNDESQTTDGRGRYNHFRALQLQGHPDASIFFKPGVGAHEVYGAIRHKWAELGWEGSSLGYPWHEETDTPDRTGRVQHFTGGKITWNSNSGANAGPITPALTMAARAEGNARFFSINGSGFTPAASVTLEYDIDDGSSTLGSVQTATGTDGNFNGKRIPITSPNEINFAQVKGTDDVTKTSATTSTE
ncbi:hypothetical protein [Arthrobacter sp. OV608]|uniref:LGFP repeat-containing protein n=1 Tax=Arthrobacter sp. OV608 TaxID=1882768 RepID=UPI0008AAE163|nr:hypothetical protein [Arthrobacter sp. OV608]SEQ79930.1 LGFP repeat-containing protein [Arthrobacter sp. OV608]